MARKYLRGFFVALSFVALFSLTGCGDYTLREILDYYNINLPSIFESDDTTQPTPIPTPSPSPRIVTRAEEREHDHQMQRDIFALFDTDERFSRDVWENSNRSEREAILTDFLAEVQEIMETMANSSINFFSGDEYSGGWYRHNAPRSRHPMYFAMRRYRRIGINRDVLEPTARLTCWREPFDLLIHEVRHAYQHEAIDDPLKHMVSDETREHWRTNRAGNNYISPPGSDGCRNCCLTRYLTQPVEWDAFHFMGWGDRVYTIISEYDGSISVYEGSWGQ